MTLLCDVLMLAVIVALVALPIMAIYRPAPPLPDLPPDESALLGVDLDD